MPAQLAARAHRVHQHHAVDRVGRQVDDQRVGELRLGARLVLRRRERDLVTGGLEHRLHARPEQQVGDERDDAGHPTALYCARSLRNCSRTDSGRPHIGVTSVRPLRTSRTASSPAIPALSSRLERAVDRRGRGGVAEAVRDQQPPVPVGPRVGLRVAGDEVQRGVDVAALVAHAQVQLEVGPVVGKRVHDLLELRRRGPSRRSVQRVTERPGGARSSPPASLESVATVDEQTGAYRVLTQACGLFDRSERGKLALTGPGAKEFLNGQVTNDVEALQPGEGVYAAFLTPKGKMLGDLRVLDLGDELWLDTERVGAAGPLQHDPPLPDRLRRRAAQADASSAGCCR